MTLINEIMASRRVRGEEGVERAAVGRRRLFTPFVLRAFVRFRRVARHLFSFAARRLVFSTLKV